MVKINRKGRQGTTAIWVAYISLEDLEIEKIQGRARELQKARERKALRVLAGIYLGSVY